MRLQFQAALLFTGLLVAGAESATAAAPDSGSILQQVRPATPPPPSPGDRGLTIESRGDSAVPSSTPFMVSALRISGNTLFDTATLHGLVQDAEGRSLTLEQLATWAGRITDHYRSRGYPLTQAIIPAQTIREGLVAIEVIEARYADVTIDNRSRVRTPLLASIVSLQPGDAVDQRDLDRALLLLSDTPGVAVNATLAAGRTTGTSSLHVAAMAEPVVAGSLALNGFGNAYTGRSQINAGLQVSNPLRHGDELSLRGVSSGKDLNYGSVGYEYLLNGHGSRVGASYSALKYELGGSLRPLDAHGTAQVQGVWLDQTLMRGQVTNLFGRIQYNHLRLHDRVDVAAIRTDRRLDNWTASLTGDLRDTLLSGGVNAWNMSWTTGRVEFDDATAQMTDAATAHSQGGYTRLAAGFARLQRLGARDALYLTISGQWSDVNLDPSDKMITGGFYAVRAYDVGAISGDKGYVATLELRHQLPTWHGDWQATGFVDHARISVNEHSWAPGANRATLSGAGAGVTFEGTSHWTGKAFVAAPFGPTPLLEPGKKSVRVWVELGKSF